jgi:nucleoside-diphosphate-sugar epimerase
VILLTGATGTAGSFVAKEFVRQRAPVRILLRNRQRRRGSKKSRLLRLSRATCRNRTAWERPSMASIESS